MKRFGQIGCFVFGAILVLLGASFIIGVNAGNPVGAVICFILAVLAFRASFKMRKAIKAEKDHIAAVGKEAYDQEKKEQAKQEVDGLGIDHVTVATRKGRKVYLVVHYKSGKVKNKRVNLGSIEYNHYAKYIK